MNCANSIFVFYGFRLSFRDYIQKYFDENDYKLIQDCWKDYDVEPLSLKEIKELKESPENSNFMMLIEERVLWSYKERDWYSLIDNLSKFDDEFCIDFRIEEVDISEFKCFFASEIDLDTSNIEVPEKFKDEEMSWFVAMK